MFQQITAVGNVGRDPEMRFTPGGQPVTTFSVAVNRRYKNSVGEQVDEVTWLQVQTWGKLAEVCKQYLAKGRQVLVEGRLVADRDTGGPRTFKRQNGEIGASFEVNAETVRFLGQKPGGTEGDAGAGPTQPAEDEDQIPF
jgi:single-strand DNA-binding protein